MTHAELAAKLLRDAAELFRTVRGPDEGSSERVDRFVSLYLNAADLVEDDPLGTVEASGAD